MHLAGEHFDSLIRELPALPCSEMAFLIPAQSTLILCGHLKFSVLFFSKLLYPSLEQGILPKRQKLPLHSGDTDKDISLDDSRGLICTLV